MNCDGNRQKVQSVKCNFPPGGQSNFVMGWGQTNEPVIRNTKYPNKNYNTNDYNSVNSGDKENVNKLNIVAGITTQNRDGGYGKAKINLFNDYNYSEKNTSIKVSQQPGGKSNICFGTDSSNYEEYRKKK